MALVVEDGTGLANAQSYISVASADAYFLARANAAWALLDTTAKEAALLQAMDYMTGQYGGLWSGQRTTTTQALDWPRYNVPRQGFIGRVYWASNSVPDAVQKAQAELAVRASAGSLLADVGAQVVSKTVGPISVTYASGTRQTPKYGAIQAMLRQFFGPGGLGQTPVIRA